MIVSQSPFRRRRPPLPGPAIVLLLTTGLAALPARAQDTGAPEQPAAQEAAVLSDAAAPTATPDQEGFPPGPPGPEDVDWLVDEEGFEYHVREMPKAIVRYRKMSDDIVRLKSGPWYRLEDEDETSLYVRIYKKGQRSRVSPTKRAAPSQADLDASAATYRVAIGSADTLRLLPFDQGLPRQSMWRNGFDLVDMNGDGHLDILHGPPRRSTSGPYIFLGDSAGHWRQWTEATYPQAPYFYGDAAGADFNGDGHMDIALGMHQKGMLAMIGDGAGAFTIWSRGIELERPGHEGDPAFASRAIDVADWDRDGKVDILAVSEGPRGLQHVNLPGAFGTVVYRNQGDGSWVKLIDKSKILGDAIVVDDFNLDGRVDFATASSINGYQRLLNLAQDDGSWQPVRIPEARLGFIWAVASGDFDADGRPDLALAYHSTELRVRRAGIDVLLARPDGGWQRVPLTVSEEERIHYHALGAGDIDGDGALDLVGTARDGQMILFRGDGEGGFTREVEPEVEARQPRCQGHHLILEDLDDDGRDEILAAFAGEECAGGGSLRVWRTEPLTAPVPAAADAP